jgi:MFS family permease
MTAQSDKKLSFRGIMQRISVLMIMLVSIESMMVTTALADIAKSFPDAPASMINLILTIPFLPLVLVSWFVTPQLVKRFDKKTLLVVAIIIYIFAGTSGFYLNSTLAQILAMRAVLGLTLGIIGPLGIDIINGLYTGLDRANMFGFANGVASILAIFVLMFAGWLTTIHWTYVFLGYFLIVIVLLLEIVFLPKMPPQAKSPGEAPPKIPYTSKQKIKLVFTVLYALSFVICGFLTQMQSSFIVVEKGIGTAVAAAGIVAGYAAAMIVSGLTYGIITLVFKRYVLVLAPGIAAVGVYLIYASTSFPMVTVGMFITGFGAGLSQPLGNDKITAIGHIQNGAFAGGLLMGAMGVGQFFSAFSVNVLGVFVEPTAINLMFADFLMLIGITIITLIYVVWNPWKGVNYERGKDEKFAVEE